MRGFWNRRISTWYKTLCAQHYLYILVSFLLGEAWFIPGLLGTAVQAAHCTRAPSWGDEYDSGSWNPAQALFTCALCWAGLSRGHLFSNLHKGVIWTSTVSVHSQSKKRGRNSCQWFPNFSPRQNHLQGFFKHWLPGPIPEFLIQWVWGEAPNLHF